MKNYKNDNENIEISLKKRKYNLLKINFWKYNILCINSTTFKR